MNFQIVHEGLDLDFGELQRFFLEVEIEDCCVTFSLSPTDSEDMVQIFVERNGRDFALRIPQLGFLRRSPPSDLLNMVKDTIISCSGYKKSTLTGLTVRDCQGSKFRPEIDIYAPKNLLVEFPGTLEYAKNAVPVQKKSLSKKKIYFHSEILSAILASTSLSFRALEEIYELAIENGVPYICYRARTPAVAIDFLTCYTVSKDLLDIISLRKGPISSYFESVVNCEDCSRPKGLLRSLAKRKKDMDYVLEVVENAPRFQDSRDDVLEELRDFLVSSLHKEVVGKYEYLEVVRQVVPENKNRFSLRRFLSP